MLSTAIGSSARTLDAKISADAPALVGLCITKDGEHSWKLDAIAQGKTRAWKVQFLADTTSTRPSRPGWPTSPSRC
jgi:hypothetical protein